MPGIAQAPHQRWHQRWRLAEIDEVDSTNLEAMRRAAAGELGPLWILARRQTQGRGRSGRGWTSAEGNLAATLLIEPGCPPTMLHQLSLLAGVAALDAVRHTLPGGAPAERGLRLKWPNDVLLGAGKLGGILVETTRYGSRTIAAIGMGMNIATAPAVPGRRTACLTDAGVRLAPRELVAVLADGMQHWLGVWDRGTGFDAVRQAWLERAGPLGEGMTINAGAGPVAGSFGGMDSNGALILRDGDGREQTFTVGDVTLGTDQV